MCGIWASVGLEVSRERLDRVAHRGPDGAGWRTFASAHGPVILGHRRLSIIDVSAAGAQPMPDPSQRYWLVYNGEIYNYRTLRDELTASGVTFRTQTDSEVLLHALITWGEAALPRLNGMFAFVLWDDVDKTLFAARDRFGIKPLYVAQLPHGVAFASEIKQLYDLPALPRRMNVRRVRDFLAIGVLDHSDETLFDGITQLRGGQLMRIDCATTGDPRTARFNVWYRLPRSGSLTLSLGAAAEQFRTLFEQSIRLQLQSDVPLGSCLSGGLDSSSIVAIASRLLASGVPLSTVTAVFDIARVDERRYVEAVVAATGARSLIATVDPADVFERAKTYVWQQDEPYGSTSIHAQMSVFERARAAGLKVMLDGQGADEPLAGYHAMFGPALADLVRAGQLPKAIAMLRSRREIHGAGFGGQLQRALPSLLPPSIRTWAQTRRRKTDSGDWLAGTALRSHTHAPNSHNGAHAPKDHDDDRTNLGTICAAQTTTTSLPMLLHWEDRSSMAHGIEARVPFLDHRLVELAIALGGAHKISGAQTKVLLRAALGDVLPPLVRDRQDKIGFATPEQEWMLGPLATEARRAVGHCLDLYPTLLDRRATLEFTDAILTRKRPFDFSLWRIICLGIWGERFGMAI